MSNNVYGVGLRNVGSYQVAGRPFCATGSAGTVRTDITFPEVSKELVVLNRHASNDLFLFFHTGSAESNRFKIVAGEQQTFSVKCKEVFLIGSAASTTYTLYASLTQIPAGRMYDLTGSGVTE
jgi:hypothetical protein